MKNLKKYESFEPEEEWEEEYGEDYNIPKYFSEFLDNHGLLDEFINNYNSEQSNVFRSGGGRINYDLDSYFRNTSRSDWLCNAFKWIETKEGYDRWVKLDYEWLKLILNNTVWRKK